MGREGDEHFEKGTTPPLVFALVLSFSPVISALRHPPCGGGPQFERPLPYSGTLFRVVEAELKTGCAAGPYRLKVFERVWSDADGRE